MVANENSKAAVGTRKQHKAPVLLTPAEPFKEEVECKNHMSSEEESVTTQPAQNALKNAHNNLKIKNRRQTGIPHNLDLSRSIPCDDNSPTSSPCISTYFDAYQTLNSSSESNSNSPTDSFNTPPLSPSESPSIIESPLSPKSSDSTFSSLSFPSATNPEQRRGSRQVSFNQTVTFIPHVPPPPNKIRKKLTKEAGARHKDLVVEIEDLGKVRLDGKNGRVIKFVPNVFPGPLNGEYGQCDVMLKDVTMEISSNNDDDDDDDDVLYITAVPIVEKDKKLRIGKHFKRYYNKLVQ